MQKFVPAVASLSLVVFVGLTGAATGQQAAAPATSEANACGPANAGSIVAPPQSAQENPGRRDWNVSVGENDDGDDSWMTRQQVARIVLYDPNNQRGRRIGITRDTPDLGERDFADIASSIRVYHGAWELCEEPNYGGVCRCFSSHTNVNRLGLGNPVTDKDLDAEGFGNTVSSVRLVRRGGR